MPIIDTPVNIQYNILLGIDFFLKIYSNTNGTINTELYFMLMDNAKKIIVNGIFFSLTKKYIARRINKIKYISLCTLLNNSIVTNGLSP